MKTADPSAPARPKSQRPPKLPSTAALPPTSTPETSSPRRKRAVSPVTTAPHAAAAPLTAAPRRKRAVSPAPTEPLATGPLIAAPEPAPLTLDPTLFRRLLMGWYFQHARVLPWRGVSDPYATWLSEVMLQQTRVATVIERYTAFLARFPTLTALAEAPEDDVLALWSGLGYYRRARMLHRAAQFVLRELGGHLPPTSAELRTLPGIGDYTAAAIASIAFGESIAVVDGNVERVLLRITGHPEQKSAAARAFIQRTASTLVPPAATTRRKLKSLSPTEPATQPANPPGDHNQAMMELGATVCIPRAPLCLQCPVVALCQTRGEHRTLPRSAPKSRRVAHLLALRHNDGREEVFLEQRSRDASLMPGMFELPPLPLDAVAGYAPILTLRHSITDTIYQVDLFADDPANTRPSLQTSIPADHNDLHWAALPQLPLLPLTGLTRKALLRLRLFHP